MFTVLVVIHVLISIVLILAILIQPAKGGDIGAVFGGGAAQSLLGATGGKAMIVKITFGLAIVFAVLSLTLALLVPSGRGGVLKEVFEERAKQPLSTPLDTTPSPEAPPAELPPAESPEPTSEGK